MLLCNANEPISKTSVWVAIAQSVYWVTGWPTEETSLDPNTGKEFVPTPNGPTPSGTTRLLLKGTRCFLPWVKRHYPRAKHRRTATVELRMSGAIPLSRLSFNMVLKDNCTFTFNDDQEFFAKCLVLSTEMLRTKCEHPPLYWHVRRLRQQEQLR